MQVFYIKVFYYYNFIFLNKKIASRRINLVSLSFVLVDGKGFEPLTPSV